MAILSGDLRVAHIIADCHRPNGDCEMTSPAAHVEVPAGRAEAPDPLTLEPLQEVDT